MFQIRQIGIIIDHGEDISACYSGSTRPCDAPALPTAVDAMAEYACRFKTRA